jgi:hypothetical protein
MSSQCAQRTRNKAAPVHTLQTDVPNLAASSRLTGHPLPKFMDPLILPPDERWFQRAYQHTARAAYRTTASSSSQHAVFKMRLRASASLIFLMLAFSFLRCRHKHLHRLNCRQLQHTPRPQASSYT